MKIRYYGFLNPNSSVSLDEIAALIQQMFGLKVVNKKNEIKALPTPVCPDCGGDLEFCALILPFRVILARSG